MSTEVSSKPNPAELRFIEGEAYVMGDHYFFKVSDLTIFPPHSEAAHCTVVLSGKPVTTLVPAIAKQITDALRIRR